MKENIYDKICLICGKVFVGQGKSKYGICKECNKKRSRVYE